MFCGVSLSVFWFVQVVFSSAQISVLVVFSCFWFVSFILTLFVRCVRWSQVISFCPGLFWIVSIGEVLKWF